MSPNQPAQNPPFSGSHPDPAVLPLYAMQLLAPEETEAIAQHLARCTDCRAELARIQGDLALTALTVDLEAPAAAARQRLLDQVARETKIVPAAPQAAVQAQTQAPPQTQSQLKPIAAYGRSDSSSSVLSIEDHQPKRSLGRAVFAGAGWATAAALAVAAGFLLKDRQSLRDTIALRTSEVMRLNTDAAAAHQLMDALTDPGAVRVTLTAQPLPRAQPIAGVTYNPDKGSLVFLASNLDPLQQYKAYELWIIPADSSAPIPVGTFHPDLQGNASIVMPDLPKGVPAKAFGITIEPDGGSQTPTMPIIMAGS